MLACLSLSGLTQQWSWSSFSIDLQSGYWRIDLLTRCSMARNPILVWFRFSGATDMSCDQSDTEQGGRQQQKPISWFTLDHLRINAPTGCGIQPPTRWSFQGKSGLMNSQWGSQREWQLRFPFHPLAYAYDLPHSQCLYHNDQPLTQRRQS